MSEEDSTRFLPAVVFAAGGTDLIFLFFEHEVFLCESIPGLLRSFRCVNTIFTFTELVSLAVLRVFPDESSMHFSEEKSTPKWLADLISLKRILTDSVLSLKRMHSFR